jgi:hypothetical protein
MPQTVESNTLVAVNNSRETGAQKLTSVLGSVLPQMYRVIAEKFEYLRIVGFYG